MIGSFFPEIGIRGCQPQPVRVALLHGRQPRFARKGQVQSAAVIRLEEQARLRIERPQGRSRGGQNLAILLILGVQNIEIVRPKPKHSGPAGLQTHGVLDPG